MFKKPWVQSVMAIVLIFGILAAFLLWDSTSNTVYIENSYLNAPVATIAPTAPGILNALYVKEGDRIAANSQLALVGSEILYAQNGGIVVLNSRSARLILCSRRNCGFRCR